MFLSVRMLTRWCGGEFIVCVCLSVFVFECVSMGADVRDHEVVWG